MKVALVLPGGVDRSGEVRIIPAFVALIRRLAPRCELHVFALAQEPRPGRWELAGAQVHNAGRPFDFARSIASIVAEHRRGKFTLVHSLFSGKCGFVTAMSARLLRIPYAVHLAGGELSAIPDIGYGGLLRWHWRVLEPRILRGAAAVTAASAPMIAAAKLLGVEANRVPLGVDLERWPPVAPRPRGNEEARLVHVASLNRVKDQPTMLRALRILVGRGVPFSLDVIGEDTVGGEIRRLAEQLGIDGRIRFHGFLTQARCHEVVRSAHVNVVSSRHEAGPLVVLESAVCGVPTAGTAVGHLMEWQPEAAVVAPPANSEALADAIATLLDDEPRRLRVASAAQARALAEDADHTAKLFLDLYASNARGS